MAVVLGHQLHHRLTVDACNAGKHVLVEKPMALSLEQCDDMIEAAANNNVKLMVGQTQHFYGTSLKAKEILDSGQLGPLMTVVCYMSKNWNHASRPPQYRSRFHGGGMWLANGVHVVDRLTWLMASQAVSVSASMGTRAHYQAADDTATALDSLQKRPRRRRRLGRFRRRRAQLREPGHPAPTALCASASMARSLSRSGRGTSGRIFHSTTRRPRCTMNGSHSSSRSNRTSSRPPPASGADTLWRSCSRPKIRPSAGVRSSSTAVSPGHISAHGSARHPSSRLGLR